MILRQLTLLTHTIAERTSNLRIFLSIFTLYSIDYTLRSRHCVELQVNAMILILLILYCTAVSSSPSSDRTPPRYTIDLDDVDASSRWNQVIDDHIDVLPAIIDATKYIGSLLRNTYFAENMFHRSCNGLYFRLPND